MKQTVFSSESRELNFEKSINQRWYSCQDPCAKVDDVKEEGTDDEKEPIYIEDKILTCSLLHYTYIYIL